MLKHSKVNDLYFFLIWSWLMVETGNNSWEARNSAQWLLQNNQEVRDSVRALYLEL